MRRHLAPALFSLSLCAVMGGIHTAGAQTLDAIAAPSVGSANVAMVERLAPPAPAITVVAPVMAGRPLVVAPTPILQNDSGLGVHDALVATPAVKADWKMPTSRALMIGGAAAAIVGLAAIGGDAGAIVALTGTAVAVYGLYLHYNR